MSTVVLVIVVSVVVVFVVVVDVVDVVRCVVELGVGAVRFFLFLFSLLFQLLLLATAGVPGVRRAAAKGGDGQAGTAV